MKKAFFAIMAAALLCCACNGDKCKCTITYKNGDTTTRTVTRPEDGKCSDLESEGKLSIGGIDIDVNTTVKCVTVTE